MDKSWRTGYRVCALERLNQVFGTIFHGPYKRYERTFYSPVNIGETEIKLCYYLPSPLSLCFNLWGARMKVELINRIPLLDCKLTHFGRSQIDGTNTWQRKPFIYKL